MIAGRSAISRRHLLAALGVSAITRLRAQQQDAPQKDTAFTSEVKVVNVFATVRDKQGKIVRDLIQDDFLLQEDGHPQTIKYFSQESNLPLTLGLLVDTSFSQQRVLGQERSASHRFFDQMLREDKDQAFVIHFDHEVELLQDLTPSRRKLEAALDDLEMPDRQPQSCGGRGGGGRPPYGSRRRRGGGTSLYDAVLLASDELMKKQSGRKALIALTDGVDNGSKVSLSSSIESAQRADTLVYSILFSDPTAYGRPFGGRPGRGMGGGYPRRYPESRPDGKKVLQQLSRETGGGFYEVAKKDPIEKIYERIQEELRNQYSLGYTPERAGAPSGYRKIQLTTKQHDLTVRTRDGYYTG